MCLCADMADILPVPLRLCVCRGEAEGSRETGGKAEAECKEAGEVDRKSKYPVYVMYVYVICM